MIKSISVASAIIFFGLPALAVTVTGNADAIIKRALTATQNTHINFATIQAPTTGGTVTISPAGVVSTAATGFSFSGTPTAGNFTITGDASTPLTVSFTNGTLSGPGTAMAIQNFTTTPATGSITTNSSGSVSINVGADLIVGTNQTSGTYAGTYQMTVSY